MKKKRNRNTTKSYCSQADFGIYSTVEYPEPDSKSIRHRHRRNNPWRNLIDDDTYSENSYPSSGYDYSDLDYEDDHDNYYSNSHYD